MKYILSATVFAFALSVGGCSLFQPAPPITEPPPPAAMPGGAAAGVPHHATQAMGHDAMMHVQQALRDKGYYWGKVDGINGPKTIAAVREFQRDLGVPVTGVVGHKEWSALGL